MNLRSTLWKVFAAVGVIGVAICTRSGVAVPGAVQLREELATQTPIVHWAAKWIAAPLPLHNPLRKLSWVWGNTGGGAPP